MKPDQDEIGKPERRLLPGEGLFGWFLLALGTFMLCQSYRIAGLSSLSSAGATPMAASFIMMVSAVVIILFNRRSPPLDVDSLLDAARRFGNEILPLQPLVVYVLIVFGYMAALEPLGFNLASFLYLFVSFWYLHRKGVWAALWIGALNVGIIYVVFQLVFQVVLPQGDLLDAALRLVGWR
jgi:putative tricarboxylic transport membrane protein